MVIDTSAILAVFFKEPHCEWVMTQMDLYVRELRMSTVNLTETLVHLQDRQPQLFSILEEKLIYSGIRFVAPSVEQAKIATQARMKFPLNLGDCFAYALAIEEGCPIVTLDKDFRALPHDILLP